MKWKCFKKNLFLFLFILPIFSQPAFAYKGFDFKSYHQGITVRGGGETLITGGNGAIDLVPVKTIFAFNASKKNGVVDGRFECLALAPAAPGSGDLTTNVMYVTGVVTGLKRISSRKAELQGTARITGLGAGEDIPFIATVEEGKTGATFNLVVDSLPIVFREIVIQGSIEVR